MARTHDQRTGHRHRRNARGLARWPSNPDAARPPPGTQPADLLVRRRARPGRQRGVVPDHLGGRSPDGVENAGRPWQPPGRRPPCLAQRRPRPPVGGSQPLPGFRLGCRRYKDRTLRRLIRSPRLCRPRRPSVAQVRPRAAWSTRRSATTPAAPTPSASSTPGSTASGSMTRPWPPTSPSSTTRAAPPRAPRWRSQRRATGSGAEEIDEFLDCGRARSTSSTLTFSGRSVRIVEDYSTDYCGTVQVSGTLLR